LIPVGFISASLVSSFSPSLYLYEAEERDRVRKDSRRVEVKINIWGKKDMFYIWWWGGGRRASYWKVPRQWPLVFVKE
jgi:hypothetical protein